MGSCTDACRQICVNTPCTATPSTSEAHVGSGAVLAGLEPDHAPGEGPAVHAHPPWLDARRRLVRQPRGSDGDEDTSGPRLGDPQALRLRRSVRPWFLTTVRIRSRGRQACFGRTLDKHTCMYTSSLLVCPPHPTPFVSLSMCQGWRKLDLIGNADRWIIEDVRRLHVQVMLTFRQKAHLV